MTEQQLLDALSQETERQDSTFAFAQVLAVIDTSYEYTATAFTNGKGNDTVVNDAGKNEGSCKVFAFAKRHALSEASTLKLFAEHYGKVLDTPEDTDHANIRTFMRYGWLGIEFAGEALTPREESID